MSKVDITERLSEVPGELIKEILKEMPQEVLLNITKVKVAGFRKGKIPPTLFLPQILKVYENSEGIREELNTVIFNLAEKLRQEMASIPVKDFKDNLINLMDRIGGKEFLLAAFLDERKGARKIARELWEALIEEKEGVSRQSKITKETKEKAVAEKGPSKGKSLDKVKGSLNKLEKKFKTEKKKYIEMLSSKDKKLARLRKDLRKYSEGEIEFKKEIRQLKDNNLEQKIELCKLKEEFTSLYGQLKKSEEDLKSLKEENLELKQRLRELEALVETKKEGEEEFTPEPMISLKGKFIFTSCDGWLVTEDEFFQHIPKNLVKEKALMTGDLIEVDFSSQKEGEIAELKIIEKIRGSEKNGYIIYDNKDYWVKVDGSKIPITVDELLRVNATEGDPVSVIIPSNSVNGEGFITKVHNVYEITTKRPRPVTRIKAQETVSPNKAPRKTLTNIKLLVLGGDSLKQRYIEELERLGASVEWQTGFGELHAIPSKVSRADLVLIITSINSHAATNVARQAAQYYKKKVLHYNSTSIRGAVVAVEKFCTRERHIELC